MSYKTGQEIWIRYTAHRLKTAKQKAVVIEDTGGEEVRIRKYFPNRKVWARQPVWIERRLIIGVVELVLLIFLTACNENTTRAEGPAPSCVPAGPEMNYQFASGVHRSQNYNCVFQTSATEKRKCVRIVSLETNEAVESCGVPWWGQNG